MCGLLCAHALCFAQTTGSTALHKAAFHGNSELLHYLISKGCDFNVKDNENATPLHKAAYKVPKGPSTPYGDLQITTN